jgi:hypothetical protein
MSRHEIPQLLEPSNLLEPLDLTVQQTGFAKSSPRVETGAGGQRPSARQTVGLPRPSGSEQRSSFKRILMVAGAVACFGAGTLLPQLHILTREDLSIGSTGANPSAPAAPLVNAAAKSDDANSPQARSSLSASQSKPAAPLNTTASVPSPANLAEGSSSPVAEPIPTPQPAANDVSVGCAGPCNQPACPPDDANCLEGGAPGRAKALTNADGSAADPAPVAQPAHAAKPQSDESERAATRATSHQEEGTHSSRPNKRSAQRERIDRQAVAKRGAATVSRSGRGQNANQRRDMVSGDSMQWWQYREDRASNWQRDRYDDYSRDRSSRVRAARDDDFLMGARWRW